ncbi:tyrosine-type recombinase/integrase [Pseudoalteromonas sp. C2R02]|uniref:tyrosine-type recombinase/integrase n=1 Tax=Pseudoalteromonas sp. C2R02 TaxID=2841565 RepID=UPI001C09D0EC|nr:tyrosine-type recombinase/integrase [Pseudoalteromonas sp. C2R02]MBU2969235.1 tyrosine-type recombinase/integrase [Pseudoalteromonas sp. C2R02]
MEFELSVVNHDESQRELGYKQWECVRALEEHYKHCDMSAISDVSSFSDDVWLTGERLSTNFNWFNKLPEERHRPLKLLVKIVTYHAITHERKAISGIHSKALGFLNFFIEVCESKSVLISEPNQPFNYLWLLTNDDVVFLITDRLSKVGTFSKSILEFIDHMNFVPASAFPNAEFLNGKFPSPWVEDKLGAEEWLVQFKNGLGFNTETKPYSALQFEVVSQIVKATSPFVDENFDTLKKALNILKDELSDYDYTENKRQDGLNRASPRLIKLKNKLSKILPLEFSDRYKTPCVTTSWYSQFILLIQSAASWLILLTTGLRNTDMRGLKNGCCKPSKRHDFINYLIVDIKKTKLRGYVLPVPEQTRRAVELLELAKFDQDCDWLLTGQKKLVTERKSDIAIERGAQSRMRDTKTFNTLLQSLAKHYDISLDTVSPDDDEATAHCVRATLAGWIGSNSQAAILILKKLFGHSNALMPDAYLAHNPLIIEQRNKNISKAQESLAEDMAVALINKKVSGNKGNQLLKGVEHIKKQIQLEDSIEMKSLTEMEMFTTLKQRVKQMLLTRAREGQIYALLTPMAAICMRACSDTRDTACAKLANNQVRKEKSIDKAITDVMGTLPNPAFCVGKECSDALIGHPWSKDLLGTFDFYVTYLEAVGHNNLDLDDTAKGFVKTYGPILKDIYQEDREVGYFG